MNTSIGNDTNGFSEIARLRYEVAKLKWENDRLLLDQARNKDKIIELMLKVYMAPLGKSVCFDRDEGTWTFSLNNDFDARPGHYALVRVGD